MNRSRIRLVGRVAPLLAAGLFPLVAAAQISGDVREARTIRASGVGEARAQPDLATVQFAVETTGMTAEAATQANAEAMERVIAALVGGGVAREDIQTSNFSLYPEYTDPARGAGDPPEIRGYRAINQVSVRTTELDRVGELIDLGLAAGANRMHGVSFELRDAAAAEAEALSNAVENARRAAETIASSLGVTLGPVLDASTDAEPVRPVYRAVAMDSFQARQEMAAVTPIEPGEQTVRATASLVFQIQ